METLIKPGRPWEQHAEEIREAVTNYALSEQFGWTPKEIKEIDEDTKMKYLCLINGINMTRKKGD